MSDAGPPQSCQNLKATIRDFTCRNDNAGCTVANGHPDFNFFGGNAETTGIVQAMLGADHKPVFAAANGQITSAQSFAQWYVDTPGVNQPFQIELPLLEVSAGRYEYRTDKFYPIDNMGWNDHLRDFTGTPHNFLFTTEIHTTFTYRAGNTFTFRGDDDLWLFINGKLALDLGGLHPEVMGTVDLDAKAAELGITPGQKYSMDIFHAERHTDASNFKVETTIDCFEDPG